MEIGPDRKINKLTINGADIEDVEDLKMYERPLTLLPRLGSEESKNIQGVERRVILPTEERLRPLLYKRVKELVGDNRVSPATISGIAEKLPLTNPDTLLQHIRSLKRAPSSLKKKTARWSVETKVFQELRNLIAYEWLLYPAY